MPDSQDPLRSLFREAASAGRSGAGLPPVSVIARRGERARRRRIAGIAVACCLVLGGSGAALATLLPREAGPTLPATTPIPSPGPPSAVPSSLPSSLPTSPSTTTTTTPSPPPSATADPSMSPTPTQRAP
ncbi:hypothetical protein OG429_35750 [Streptomyces sp. NBC_00190]|uniref:hypothetical protein n=1 Tax=unclassified Streptomyces TaxID=2593676 RepID=UPI002E2A9432|nr:hypothetical protein [Streptomyces sp. NBC_00190]WSZ44153.1 hypothetical protein OG239_38215 [Streptomyces sp. NBC_00868]